MLLAGVIGCAPNLVDFYAMFYKACRKTGVSKFSKMSWCPLPQGCVWWSIFRLDARVEKALLKELQSFAAWKAANGKEGLPVLAIHVRTGDKTAFQQVASASQEKNLQRLAERVLACAAKTEQSIGLVNPSYLVISDSTLLRDIMRSRLSKKVWSTDVAPAHYNYVEASAADRHLGSVVDLLMLAFSEGLLKSSASGFSHLAEAVGLYPHDKVRDLSSCGIDVHPFDGV
jgi:hypothetical protein